MIFEDLVTTTNAMQSLQRKIAFKENKDKQDNTDGKYRLLLFKANGLVDTISFLYSNTAIPKDENLVESIKSLMDDLEKIVDTGLASHEGVLKAGTSFEEINEKLKIEWPSHYASLTNATFSTLEAIKDINPNDVETCLKKITSAKEWDLDVKRYEIQFSNQIIEQFMLTANEVIAEKFYWLEAPFIYRVHEVPDKEKIDELNKFLFNLGLKIKYNKDSIHPSSFAEILKKVKDEPEERVVSNLVLRTLKVARYESENKGHFGIASKFYCHFTSPIRRYPDLFIHRVISTYLDNNYNVDQDTITKYGGQAVAYAERSSEREKIAQKGRHNFKHYFIWDFCRARKYGRRTYSI